MKTQITITVEHPDATDAYWVVADVLRPFINDANDASEEGWTFSVSPSQDEKQLRDRAFRTALSLTLSEFPDDWTTDQILEGIEGSHEDIVVWETFQHWDVFDLVNYIEETAVVIHLTYA